LIDATGNQNFHAMIACRVERGASIAAFTGSHSLIKGNIVMDALKKLSAERELTTAESGQVSGGTIKPPIIIIPLPIPHPLPRKP
jgi:hypothetical protein